MNAKRKIIISVCAFALIVVATVVSVIAVLAAQNVTVKTSLNIQYTAASNVIGKVKASYVMQDTTKTANLGEKTFNGTESNNNNQDLTAVGTLSFVNNTNEYIDFTFQFTNTSTVVDYTAKLTFSGTPSNVKIYHKIGTANTFTEVAGFANLPTLTVDKNTTSYTTANTYVLRIALYEDLKDASFNGTLQWALESEDR